MTNSFVYPFLRNNFRVKLLHLSHDRVSFCNDASIIIGKERDCFARKFILQDLNLCICVGTFHFLTTRHCALWLEGDEHNLNLHVSSTALKSLLQKVNRNIIYSLCRNHEWSKRLWWWSSGPWSDLLFGWRRQEVCPESWKRKLQ